MNRPIRLREATAQDADFLVDMLVDAINWTGDHRVDRAAVETDPQLSHYVAGWPRPDDFGVIAAEPDGAAAGAAWARTLTPEDPGYGYVAPQVPEISMAVVPAWRGRGVGRALLRALLDTARARTVPAVSLSVEDGNPAAELYRSVGFRTVGRHGGSDTMLLELGR